MYSTQEKRRYDLGQRIRHKELTISAIDSRIPKLEAECTRISELLKDSEIPRDRYISLETTMRNYCKQIKDFTEKRTEMEKSIEKFKAELEGLRSEQQ
jgi:chromosome segregation ATPase